jgi:hypothetical protein
MLPLPAPSLPAASIAPPAEEIEARIGELVAAHAFTILVAIHARRRDFSGAGAAAVEAGSCHMRDLVLLRASLSPDKLAAFEQIARQPQSASACAAGRRIHRDP